MPKGHVKRNVFCLFSAAFFRFPSTFDDPINRSTTKVLKAFNGETKTVLQPGRDREKSIHYTWCLAGKWHPGDSGFW
ncbi:hypothetical protein BaRGS_00025655, partial [Batillaria attramentaria]